MTTDELGFFEWLFKGMVGILFTIGGWAWLMLIKKVERTSEDLSSYKTEVAKTYAEKGVIERIHDRIDSVQRGIEDVKTLLITTKRNN